MKVNGASGVNIPASAIGMDAGIGGQADPMVRDLQRQIEDLQNRMKELSSDPKLTAEMKAKKRQELQKQISDLEVQLRQRRMEVKREEAMKKRQENYSIDELIGTKQQTKRSDKQNAGLSAGSMEAMISADVSVKQADVNGNVARKMEGRAGVLEAEIKQDSAMGAAPTGKEEALTDAQAKANEATFAQMGALAQANQAAEKANETDKSRSTEKTNENNEGKSDDKAQNGTENTFDTEQLGVPFSRGYQPVDVKL